MRLRIGKNFELVIHGRGDPRPTWKQVKPKPVKKPELVEELP